MFVPRLLFEDTDDIPLTLENGDKGINVLSLFDGISCARLALDKANIKVNTYYASEIDKYAIAISKKNYPSIIPIGCVENISFIDNTLISHIDDMITFKNPSIDLIIGGSPCQDLSIANKGREGLAGKRSGLFWEYVRIVKEIRPKYFILENVASMPKEAKMVITEALFGVTPNIINASLVSAQQRKRLFWVGVKNGDTYDSVLIPQPTDKGIMLKDIIVNEVDEKYIISDKHYERMKSHNKNFKVRDLDGKTTTIIASYYKIPSDGNYVRVAKAPNGKILVIHMDKTPHSFKEVRTDIGKAKRREHRKLTGEDTTRRGIDDKMYIPNTSGKANCATTAVGVEGLIADTDYVRKLLPIEFERLQCIPDYYTALGIDELGKEIEISDTQRYKTLGNSFNAEVVAHIFRYISQKEYKSA
jgi:DNA (cytosine-5)-methyltransferase 3A